MKFPSQESEVYAIAEGSASAQPPTAAGAAGLQSPRLVIRGESSENNDIEAPRSDGKAFGAFTDYLNVTFRLPSWKDPAQGFFERLSEVVGPAFGIMEDQGRGLYGYARSFRFERGTVLYAFGGEGCQGAFKFPQLWALKIPHPPVESSGLFRSFLKTLIGAAVEAVGEASRGGKPARVFHGKRGVAP